MNTLQEQFTVEARELIQQASEDLIALEREGFAAERIDRVFRAFHTLKGSAGIVELPAMGLILHAAEDVLAAIQTGGLELTPQVIDCALGCLDLVSEWVDSFASHGSLPSDAGEAGVAMTAQLRGLLVGDEPKPEAVSSPEITSEHTLPQWVASLIDTAQARIVEKRGTDFVALSYEPRADCFFLGDDPFQTMRKVPNLLALHIEAVKPWPPPPELDPYSCNLRLQCIAAASRSEMADIFRLVPDQVRMVDIPASALGREGEKGNENRLVLVRSIVEEQLRMLRSASDREDFSGRVGAAARAALNALRYGSRASLAGEIERARKAALSLLEATPLLAALEKALALLTPTERAPSGSTAEPKPQPSDRAGSRSLRVDEGKIDALGNLAGELIVLKNALAHLAKRVEDESVSRDLSRAVRREADAMERLSAELHAAILQLRLVPIAQVFRRFPRLVRDMAQRLDKKVTLVTQGETTEADKTIVDRLFDPLLHLVRNAVDHGIESVEERRSAGKPEIATITMRASPSGRRFIVEISDDGRGIDPNNIRRKAAERQLLPAEELAAMPDEQVMDLIFSAGFSTVEQVSDISGRGVGMDVVRASVQQMEGRVSLTSTVGLGTSVRLELPANIATSRVLVVEAGGQIFGIPMDAVTETIRLSPDRISQIKNNAGFVLRDRIVPICALSELMNLADAPRSDSGAKLLVVTEVSGKIAALEIDAIHDRLEVVLKPMHGFLSGARGYAGTTLLGDGRVLLVLDLKEVLP